MVFLIASKRLCLPLKSLITNHFTTARILGRYEECPETLFRIANANGSVAMREKSAQEFKLAVGYDYEARDGLILPTPSDGHYVGPNGFALRPVGDSLRDTLIKMKNNAAVIEMDCGTILPEGIILIHERTGHYSLQTTVPIKPALFSKNVNKFLASMPSRTLEEFLIKYPCNRVGNVSDSLSTPLRKQSITHKLSPTPSAAPVTLYPVSPSNVQTSSQTARVSKVSVPKRRVIGERAGTRISKFRGIKDSWKTRKE